ncbi:hypothetical protein NQ318_002536 [Aromia moschata]|uniref:alanine--glyoxylate transaminase n=1 Tax=Aromia moschata TaxID=1265417 RepID=A0AAV8Y3G0_9CUCU|nr:hypothetical protein NQ318_002536 [Aromia moschata]
MSLKLDYSNPLEKGGKIFNLPALRQLGPGPCNVSRKVLSAMMFEPLPPPSRVFIKKYRVSARSFRAVRLREPPRLSTRALPAYVIDVQLAGLSKQAGADWPSLCEEVQKMVKYLFQTKNPMTLVVQSSGNGGNEAMVTNLADPGDTVIVATAGVWGVKVADMARRYRLNVVELTKPPGEVYSYEELEEQIVKHKAVALFVTHGESSGGTLQPLDGLADICHKYNCLLAVDAIVSLGIVPIFVDKWKIDAITGGSQKGLGAPAGMTLMTFSAEAHKRMQQKKWPPPYIFDMLSLADSWKCFDKPIKYHYTYGSPMLAAVRQALEEICEEGLENAWERHKKCTDLFVSQLPKLGMKHFVEKPENRLFGVTCAVLPKDVKMTVLLDYLYERYETEIGFGIGPTAGAGVVRVGFLAQNAKPDVVEYFVKALEDAIGHCRDHSRMNGFDKDDDIIIAM